MSGFDVVRVLGAVVVLVLAYSFVRAMLEG